MASSTTNEKRTVVRGLGEIAFRVNNLDAMQHFYEHVIGLPLMTRVPNCAFLGMAKQMNESRSSMVNNDWLPATLCARSLETYFVRDGFVVLESFVNKVELKEIVPLVESILTSSHEVACTRPHNTLAPLRWNDPIVRLLLKSDPTVQALTDVLRADDLKWISGYISISASRNRTARPCGGIRIGGAGIIR